MIAIASSLAPPQKILLATDLRSHGDRFLVSYAAFKQPPRDETVATEVFGFFFVETVESLRRIRFACEIENLRRAHLQARS